MLCPGAELAAQHSRPHLTGSAALQGGVGGRGVISPFPDGIPEVRELVQGHTSVGSTARI